MSVLSEHFRTFKQTEEYQNYQVNSGDQRRSALQKNGFDFLVFRLLFVTFFLPSFFFYTGASSFLRFLGFRPGKEGKSQTISPSSHSSTSSHSSISHKSRGPSRTTSETPVRPVQKTLQDQRTTSLLFMRQYTERMTPLPGVAGSSSAPVHIPPSNSSSSVHVENPDRPKRKFFFLLFFTFLLFLFFSLSDKTKNQDTHKMKGEKVELVEFFHELAEHKKL